MTKDELEKVITDKATEIYGHKIDETLKGQLKEIVQDTVAKLRPSAEDNKVDEIKKQNRFKDGGDFLNAVYKFRHMGVWDDRLTYLDSKGQLSKPVTNAEQKATLVEGTDSAGGFLVQEQFYNELMAIGLENSIIRGNGAFVIPMGSDTLNIPRVNDTAHTSSVYGGVIAYWESEGATMNETEPVFGQCKLTAKNLNGYTKASNQLLQDSATPLDPLLKRMFGESWAWYEDLAFIRGTGSGQPLGFLNAACLVSATRQDTDEVFVQDIFNLYSRMLPGGRDRAVWIMNHEVLPQLLRMHSANTSTNAYGAPTLFQQSLVDPVAGTILGRPYFVTEKMSALGDAGDIAFVDLGYYLIGDRQTLAIDASTHVYFTTNHTAWRFTKRVDGQPWLSSAITPYKGTATLGPFVTLAATS